MNPTRTLRDAAAIVLLLVATALGAHAALDEAPLFPAPTASTAATGGSGSSSGEYGIELGLLDKLMLHYESAGGASSWSFRAGARRTTAWRTCRTGACACSWPWRSCGNRLRAERRAIAETAGRS